MLVIVASLFLWQTRHQWSVALLFIGVIGGSFLNEALKVAFGRARPGTRRAGAWGSSVPDRRGWPPRSSWRALGIG